MSNLSAGALCSIANCCEPCRLCNALVSRLRQSRREVKRRPCTSKSTFLSSRSGRVPEQVGIRSDFLGNSKRQEDALETLQQHMRFLEKSVAVARCPFAKKKKTTNAVMCSPFHSWGNIHAASSLFEQVLHLIPKSAVLFELVFVLHLSRGASLGLFVTQKLIQHVPRNVILIKLCEAFHNLSRARAPCALLLDCRLGTSERKMNRGPRCHGVGVSTRSRERNRTCHERYDYEVCA